MDSKRRKKLLIPLVLVVLLGLGCAAMYFLPDKDTKEDMMVLLEDAVEHQIWYFQQTTETAATLPREEVHCLAELWMVPDGTPKARYRSGRTQAHLYTDLIFQDVTISGTPRGYALHWGCGRDRYDADFSKDGETWTLDRQQIDNVSAQTGREEVEAMLAKAREQAKAGKLSAEKQALLERINQAYALCAVTYPTWDAALSAAQSLDLDALNIFDLE